MNGNVIVERSLSKINIPIKCFKFDYLPLIFSILVVSVSGGMKIYLAYKLLGIGASLTCILTATLVTYATYAFDRGVGCKEDEQRSAAFNKLLLISAIAASIASFILFASPTLAIPFLIAYLYAKGIGGFRLKGGAGVKNAVVGLTWVALAFILLGECSLSAVIIYFFLFSKSFINTIIYDVKDVENDRAAGIATIPTLLSTTHLRVVLLGASAVTHLILCWACICGLLIGTNIIAFSAVHSTFYILRYSVNRAFLRNTLVDGEWVLYGTYSILRDCCL